MCVCHRPHPLRRWSLRKTRTGSYSRSFAPAVDILEWQLVGDIFKLTSWALAFTILARGRAFSFLATESVAGVLLLGTTYPALKLLGISGFGMAYALAYLGYCLVVYGIVRSGIGFRFTAGNLRMLVLVGGGVLAVRVILSTTASLWIQVLPGVIGLAAAVHSLRRGSKLWRAPEAV